MIGQAVSSSCRICRSAGIVPVFLISCFAAWLLSNSLGWLAAIVLFVVLQVIGTVLMRAACAQFFPYLDAAGLDDQVDAFADPSEFAPDPEAIHDFDELAPSHVDATVEQARERDVKPEDLETLLPDETADLLSQVGIGVEEPVEEQNLFDEEAFHDRVRAAVDWPEDGDALPEKPVETSEVIVETAMPAVVEPEETAKVEAEAPEEDEPEQEEPEASVTAFVPPKNERPASLLGGEGRRLAHDLVMVGASPSQERDTHSQSGQALRPASLLSARATGPDDLTLIRGVGEGLEELLHQLGYYHFDQIAGWTQREVQWVDENLEGFKGRVSRDQWVSQAIVLARGQESDLDLMQDTAELKLLRDEE